jgi:hypothetical protein
MTERIKEIVKRGTWLYDGTVRAEVLIIRQNYFEGPKIVDEEPTPGYPPTDSQGCFYAIEYDIPRGGAGGSGPVFGSLADAVQKAEATIKGPIVWKD